MNDELILGLGSFCKDLLSSEAFTALTNMYSQQCAADILSTKPADNRDREQIYAAYTGFEGFLALARKFADAHDKINAAAETPTQDTTDDPRVHDIYGRQN